MHSCPHHHLGAAGWSADPAAGLLAQSTGAATAPSADAMDPPAAQELVVARLTGQAAGSLKIEAVEVSARVPPELDHWNWLALALMEQVDLQVGNGYPWH